MIEERWPMIDGTAANDGVAPTDRPSTIEHRPSPSASTDRPSAIDHRPSGTDRGRSEHRSRKSGSTGQPSPEASDLALLRAIRAWGGGDFAERCSWLSESWRDRLRPFWASALREKPDDAWSALRSDHEVSARLDPSRVHPSWFIRALKTESAAVRRAVVSHAPPAIREVLLRAFKIDDSELATDREPDPEALKWALALWAERLVGDVPADSDPPVVVAMTRLGPRDLARLVKACGVVKLAFALGGNGRNGLDESIARFTPTDRVRLGFFRRHVGAPDPRLVPLAGLDLKVIDGDRRRGLARVGLVTFGRLLSAVEPHRARWALQHVPYPLARLMRIKGPPPLSLKAMLAWESWVLEAAWSRLLREGRLIKGRASRVESGSEGLP
jgi:hypothetical protein